MITDGASKRESVELLRREGAEPVAVLIALDRQERGGSGRQPSERSAVEDFVRDYGIPVIAVATLADLLDYLISDADPSLAEHVDAVARTAGAMGSERDMAGAPVRAALLALAGGALSSRAGRRRRPHGRAVSSPASTERQEDRPPTARFRTAPTASSACSTPTARSTASSRRRSPPTNVPTGRAPEGGGGRAEGARKGRRRRDRNLMQRYPHEAAHREAREKALDDVRISVRNSEPRIAQLKAERKPLDDEKEFYVGKPLPTKLKLALDSNDASLEAQKRLVQNQQPELVRITALYDAELARLKKLWAGAPAGSLGPLAGGPGSAARSLRQWGRPRPRCRRRPAYGSSRPAGGRPRGPLNRSSPQQRVHLRRIGLAAARLHGLADECVERLLLAGAELLHQLRVAATTASTIVRARRCRGAGAGRAPRRRHRRWRHRRARARRTPGAHAAFEIVLVGDAGPRLGRASRRAAGSSPGRWRAAVSRSRP